MAALVVICAAQRVWMLQRLEGGCWFWRPPPPCSVCSCKSQTPVRWHDLAITCVCHSAIIQGGGALVCSRGRAQRARTAGVLQHPRFWLLAAQDAP